MPVAGAAPGGYGYGNVVGAGTAGFGHGVPGPFGPFPDRPFSTTRCDEGDTYKQVTWFSFLRNFVLITLINTPLI